MKKIKIALLGLGNVGRGVWKIFESNKDEVLKRSGYDVEITKILVRDKSKPRGVEVPDELLTTSYSDIINDDEIKIVVELMGGIDPAKGYILEAIKKGKHIVTANKMLLAKMGDELFEEADKHGVKFNYEASVAGGIPIISGINESLTANKIERMYGIVNGTTNYILSKMELEGVDFDDALKEAQEMGYAEADPTSDIEGYDAQYKLAILASLAFGTKVEVEDVYREGITNITSQDIEYAKELGLKIKLLATVKEDDKGLDLRVHPTMIPATHPLANVYDAFNAIFIRGNAVGDLMFYGRGAGDLPTGSAVVSDIISILRSNVDHENDIPVVKNNLWKKEIKDIKDAVCRYYIRITTIDEPGVLGSITKAFGDNEVSIRSIIQRGKKRTGQYVTLVLETHHTTEGSIISAIDDIYEIKEIKKIDNLIRIEEFR
ncbi:homoserine dehydrogenase [uncultured Clostridium sp.]|jgi:homoserine dehydrogenase|uniref:homoserine dehydrogenase n=1 Tax=uncultured Clostridium sp. TaxID=59620 RepID=UPI002606F444|nr:homoserine dehydrogenase [uncultured Clostridium sp.]